MIRTTVVVAGETVDVTLERTAANGVEATIGGRVYSLEASPVEPGIYLLNWNHQSIEVVVLPTGDEYSVSIGGHRIPVEILNARRKLQRTARLGHVGGAEIHAPMPGKIVRVLVSEGMDVATNQGLVVMEAMKMQNEIKSPVAGKLRKLTVVEGETVRSGTLIAIVE